MVCRIHISSASETTRKNLNPSSHGHRCTVDFRTICSTACCCPALGPQLTGNTAFRESPVSKTSQSSDPLTTNHNDKTKPPPPPFSYDGHGRKFTLCRIPPMFRKNRPRLVVTEFAYRVTWDCPSRANFTSLLKCQRLSRKLKCVSFTLFQLRTSTKRR